MDRAEIIDRLLTLRGIAPSQRDEFLHPNYDRLVEQHDPFDLPDMRLAVGRLKLARDKRQSVLIYGDYDADGVTSTALLLDGLRSMGFENVRHFLPNRFSHGYGLNAGVVSNLTSDNKPAVLVTVDCGSLNHAEIKLANHQGIDVIVTDHHHVAATQPEALAVINPRRAESKYPFHELAGVGVAFNLIRALQTELGGLASGQEKWLLDLVAIGTISDLMPLVGENRVYAYYGLKVLPKTRRKGLRQLFAKTGVDLNRLSGSTIGFTVGPRFNAAGRMKSADMALDVLTADDATAAAKAVDQLEYLNQKRRLIQQEIYKQATEQATASDDPVLILRGQNWHEGIVGIVASNIQEQFQKPTFILDDQGDFLKGSARSFGGFSVFAAIEQARDLILQGGGHSAAGGVKLLTENYDAFRAKINDYYQSLNLTDQLQFLERQPDIILDNFTALDLDLFNQLHLLEPFGEGNPEPVFEVRDLTLKNIRLMGDRRQHAKLQLTDVNGKSLDGLVFNAAGDLAMTTGDKVRVRGSLMENVWQGRRNLEMKLVKVEIA